MQNATTTPGCTAQRRRPLAAPQAVLAAIGALGCSASSPGAAISPEGQRAGETDVVVDSPTAVEGRYRGFNLQGMYKLEWNQASGYREKDFRILREHGFNYVRLPLDYKTYTAPGDWHEFLPDKLALIDQAVVWGQEHGVHVALNLHQAPGYCVHDPASLEIPENQRLDLWHDAEAQAAFVAHWRTFAERYAEVDAEFLSFNLVNEPNDSVDEATYLKVMRPAIEAIRAISPERPIELDGTAGGRSLIRGLTPGDVRQSLHAYDPHGLTHYGASWIAGAADWPVPEWPPSQLVGHLYGEMKKAEGFQSPLVIEGDFPKGTQVTVEIGQVSQEAHFLVQAGASPILEKRFRPGPGQGDWKTVVYSKQQDAYQNIYDREYSARTRRAEKQLSLEVRAGDWLTIKRLVIERRGERVELTPGITSWGVPQARYALSKAGRLEAVRLPEGFEERYEPLGYLEPWKAYAQAGGQVIVGEFGVYKSVPHETALAFMKDLLTELRDADIGWALWNFDGDFGPLNSGRADVEYESYEGYRLDRKMLELLESL